MDNRSNILDCALRLFAARGYDAVGVQEICEAAGVTKPTLYHYFGNKRGLLAALVADRAGPFVRRLADAAAVYNGNLSLSFQHIIETYFQFATQEATLYRMLLMLWFAVPDDDAFHVVAAFNAEQQRIIEELFERAVPNYGNMRGRQRIYAATFIGMINTYIGLALNKHIELNDAVVRQAIQQFSYGIYS
ncbi:MAG TPA: TetR/AcrR family transcriptional regulator [Roseiflexaceae bacterium]|jgi:TetR/AcrR family transcriptional regulator|nr:TetR/AcrR family transcriptional regulator [Roseiflexaceae bacterium]